MKEIESGPDLRLSYSSAQDMRLCEQRWYHRKVANTPVDEDYEEGDHFMIGKAFHHVLEMTKHEKPKKMSRWLKECTEHEDIGLPKEYYPLITAMVTRYCKLHKKIGLEVVCVEEKMEEEDFFLGYADAVMKNDKGHWWVVDLKTAKSFRADYIPPLIKNTQLSLYALYAMPIAEKYGLNPKKFKGARYRTTMKPGLKRKANETDGAYAKRLFEACNSYDVELPLKYLDMDAVDEHEIVQQRTKSLLKGLDKPRRNYSSCTAFFKPCPYFSKCHGIGFEEAIDEIKVIEET